MIHWRVDRKSLCDRASDGDDLEEIVEAGEVGGVACVQPSVVGVRRCSNQKVESTRPGSTSDVGHRSGSCSDNQRRSRSPSDPKTWIGPSNAI
jgi:hypothetical protein